MIYTLLLLLLGNILLLFLPAYTLYISIGNIILTGITIYLFYRRKTESIEITTEIEDTPVKQEIEEETENQEPEAEESKQFETYLTEASDKFHFFKLSIPLMEELTRGTQQFEEETLKKVFAQFEEIWNESETLIKESELSMESIFDTNRDTNLGYILASSKEINRDFNSFIPVLESMNQLTEKFVNISHESFQTISRTTKEIEDLAEQVKVISINVRIEAARIQDSGGFKVLGSDITKFADKTSEFAQSTNDKINNTITTIDEMKSDLEQRLHEVAHLAKNMSQKINPFESILEQSAISLKDVITKLNRVSGELNRNIKNSLANLQFQDVTRQETEHIIDFLRHIESIVQFAKMFDYSIPKEKDLEIKRDILTTLDKLSTTGNEAKRIQEFSERWGVVYKKDDTEDFNSIDDGTFLF